MLIDLSFALLSGNLSVLLISVGSFLVLWLIAYCWSGVRCSTSSASGFVYNNDNSLYIQGRLRMMKNLYELKLKFKENLHSEVLNGNSRVGVLFTTEKKA